MNLKFVFTKCRMMEVPLLVYATFVALDLGDAMALFPELPIIPGHGVVV